MMIYDSWFNDTEFVNYTKIAEWTIINNVILGGDTVSFYSRNDKIQENYLKIKQYSNDKLPKDVIVNLIEASK